MGEDGGATTGALSDGVQGIESSEHHNPPEMLDGLDGKIYTFNFIIKILFRFNIFPFAFHAIILMRIMRILCKIKMTYTSLFFQTYDQSSTQLNISFVNCDERFNIALVHKINLRQCFE